MGEHGSRFYRRLAGAAMVAVFLGFARTYFLKAVSGAPPVSPALHVHAAVFCAWLLLFLAQAVLIPAGRRNLHRRLGVAGAALGVLLVAVGFLVATESAHRGFRGVFLPAAPGTAGARAFAVNAFTDLSLFTVFAGASLVWRSRPEAHKRLMTLATINLLAAALTRLPLGPARVPVALGAFVAFAVAPAVHDRLTSGRVHPVALWGGAVTVASVPLRIAVGRTDLWQRFVAWLVQ
jgi:hypothetical protein